MFSLKQIIPAPDYVATGLASACLMEFHPMLDQDLEDQLHHVVDWAGSILKVIANGIAIAKAVTKPKAKPAEPETENDTQTKKA